MKKIENRLPPAPSMRRRTAVPRELLHPGGTSAPRAFSPVDSETERIRVGLSSISQPASPVEGIVVILRLGQ